MNCIVCCLIIKIIIKHILSCLCGHLQTQNYNLKSNVIQSREKKKINARMHAPSSRQFYWPPLPVSLMRWPTLMDQFTGCIRGLNMWHQKSESTSPEAPSPASSYMSLRRPPITVSTTAVRVRLTRERSTTSTRTPCLKGYFILSAIWEGQKRKKYTVGALYYTWKTSKYRTHCTFGVTIAWKSTGIVDAPTSLCIKYDFQSIIRFLISEGKNKKLNARKQHSVLLLLFLFK